MSVKQKYITRAGNTLMVRVTGCKQKNFHISQLEEAIAHRDHLCKKMGLPYDQQYSHKASRLHTKNHRDKECSLPVGLTYAITKNVLADGTIAIYTAIRASITVNGKSTYKAFSVDRHGHDTAKEMAMKWRKEQMSKKLTKLTKYQASAHLNANTRCT